MRRKLAEVRGRRRKLSGDKNRIGSTEITILAKNRLRNLYYITLYYNTLLHYIILIYYIILYHYIILYCVILYGKIGKAVKPVGARKWLKC